MGKLIEWVRGHKLLLQLFRFGVVGGTAAVLDWCVLALCVRVLGMDSIVSNVIAFLVAAPYNYWASTRYVFDFRGRKDSRELFVLFVVLVAVGLGINELVMYVGDRVLSFDPLVVKVAGIVLAAVFNFVTRKLILEKRKSDEKAAV